MKKFLTALAVVSIIPLLMGMGGILGEDSPDKIPLPDEKFNAVYIDQFNVTTECTNVSIQGKSFIEGKRGEGTYAIPFQNVTSVIFLMRNGTLEGHVTLKDGIEMILVLKGDQKAYGKTRYGTFQIKLGDLKKMVFTERD
ncbi:MAG TPA: hypothetical protein ENO00_09370 [Deltaproteobacteria bacterium]|nr:hypothetical protein [Deltaproteobacteria bacterium]